MHNSVDSHVTRLPVPSCVDRLPAPSCVQRLPVPAVDHVMPFLTRTRTLRLNHSYAKGQIGFTVSEMSFEGHRAKTLFRKLWSSRFEIKRLLRFRWDVGFQSSNHICFTDSTHCTKSMSTTLALHASAKSKQNQQQAGQHRCQTWRMATTPLNSAC